MLVRVTRGYDSAKYEHSHSHSRPRKLNELCERLIRDRYHRSEESLQDVPEGEIESNWDQVVDKYVSQTLFFRIFLRDVCCSFDNMELKPELLRGIV